MRKLASFLTMIIALVLFAGLYFATPYLMHAQSHAGQFLALLAAGAAVGFGVMLLIAGVVMRTNVLPKVPPPPTPQARSVRAPLPTIDHLQDVRTCLNMAVKHYEQMPTDNPTSLAVASLVGAMSGLVRMVEATAKLQEGKG